MNNSDSHRKEREREWMTQRDRERERKRERGGDICLMTFLLYFSERPPSQAGSTKEGAEEGKQPSEKITPPPFHLPPSCAATEK